ncbi:MAG: hypothetical protein ABIP94_20830 [Planctomycetota bacterium]
MHNRLPSNPFAPKPPLYPFHNRQQKNRFLQLVREFLGRDGSPVAIENGMAVVEGGRGVHGLQNLAQVCHQSPFAAWPGIIAEHLGKSDEGRLEAVVGDVLTSFERSRDQLCVRVYPKEFAVGPLQHHIVHRFDLPETCTVLAVDIGPSIIPVPTPVAEAWGVPLPMLFECALQNLPNLGKPRWERLQLPPSRCGAIDLLHDDFHATSHALRPAAFQGRTGQFGNLIGLPARGVLISHAIAAMPAISTIEAMLAITTGKHRDGPGSITPHLFWRTPEGQFYLQQGSTEGGRVRFVPSPEFVELLVRLKGERPSRDEG